MRIGPTGQRRLTAGHPQSRAPVHLPQGLRSPHRVSARLPGDPAGCAACPELAILVQERETPHSYMSRSYSVMCQICDREFIVPWIRPKDNPVGCAHEDRRGALASEFPKGETAYRCLDTNINRYRKINRASAKGVGLICHHAVFSINNNIQVASQLCHIAAGCKLEAHATSGSPGSIEIPPAVFEKG